MNGWRGLLQAWLLLSVAAGATGVTFVSCMTTKGPFTMEVHPEWAPNAAERFLKLVDAGFYTDIALFRSIRSFLVQFGISDKPEQKKWHTQQIPDDPNLHIPFRRGMVSFAAHRPNARTTQLFIAYSDLPFLGQDPWETPFAVLIDGFDTLDSLTTSYGDGPPFGQGPDQLLIHKFGNKYLAESYPDLDYIHWCDRVWADGVANIQSVFSADHFRPAAPDSIPAAHCLVITLLVICSAVSIAMYVLRRSVSCPHARPSLKV
jgi:cyclophilin family peptidyl-prolyl cis-trans isomerase